MLKTARRLNGAAVNSPARTGAAPARGEPAAAASACTSPQDEKRSRDDTSPGIWAIRNPQPPSRINPMTAAYSGGVKSAATCHISVLRKKKAAKRSSSGRERAINRKTWRIWSTMNSNDQRSMGTRP